MKRGRVGKALVSTHTPPTSHHENVLTEKRKRADDRGLAAVRVSALFFGQKQRSSEEGEEDVAARTSFMKHIFNLPVRKLWGNRCPGLQVQVVEDSCGGGEAGAEV